MLFIEIDKEINHYCESVSYFPFQQLTDSGGVYVSM